MGYFDITKSTISS